MSENILGQMGIEPFPDHESLDFDEVAYQPPPAKTKTSVVLSAATRRQLDWLAAQGHGNQSEVIALAVYGMWRMEQDRTAPAAQN